MRAHELAPNARTLRGIAMACFELREYAAAIRHIDAALAATERPLTEAHRAHVSRLRAQASAFVARYELALAPAGARVLVDGVPAIVEQGVLFVDLGAHTLEISAPAHRSAHRRVRVVGGERERLEITLEPEPEPELAPTIVVAAASPRARDDTAAHALFVGSGITFGGAGAALGYWIDREVAVGQCEARPCTNERAIREQRDAGLGVMVALASVAAGLAIAGGVSMATAASAQAFVCAPGGLAIVCRARF